MNTQVQSLNSLHIAQPTKATPTRQLNLITACQSPQATSLSFVNLHSIFFSVSLAPRQARPQSFNFAKTRNTLSHRRPSCQPSSCPSFCNTIHIRVSAVNVHLNHIQVSLAMRNTTPFTCLATLTAAQHGIPADIPISSDIAPLIGRVHHHVRHFAFDVLPRLCGTDRKTVICHATT